MIPRVAQLLQMLKVVVDERVGERVRLGRVALMGLCLLPSGGRLASQRSLAVH